MSDKEELFTVKYRAMYRAMIDKDGAKLGKLLDDSFVLIHMTGMQQDKQEFIRAVENGTLNYFSEEIRGMQTIAHKDFVQFTGKSLVNAAVFGGGRHTWRLQLAMKYKLINGEWLITEAVASTW